MEWRGSWRRGAAALLAAVVIAGIPAATTAAPAAGAPPGPAVWPRVKLLPAAASITLPRAGGSVYLDPGIWVASLGAALRLDVQRADYRSPVTVTQVVSRPGGGTVRVRWPGSVVAPVPGRLRGFFRLTVATTAGRVLLTRSLGFCPDSADPERALPSAAVTSPYPQQCVADPFFQSLVWGVARGWAVDPQEASTPVLPLRLGHYQVTETIAPRYRRLLHITAADAVARVRLTVTPGPPCCTAPAVPRRPGAPGAARGGARPPAPRVPRLADPPASSLPDLIPLPSWGIWVSHHPATRHHPASDQLDFSATVWVGGHGPLDVQGFRSPGSPRMAAYQYFWQDGRVIGRAPAGTMGFDAQRGHDHWHFQQFARYSLLAAARRTAVRSYKMGFCLAPTEPVDLLLPGAPWQPPSVGLGGQCGVPTALWVRELLPVGWGDTYVQYLQGQSFDITGLPDGTYYIEIAANPEHLLHETDTGNDVSLRRVILGGSPGHRWVRVPAWHGIDPEGAAARGGG